MPKRASIERMSSGCSSHPQKKNRNISPLLWLTSRQTNCSGLIPGHLLTAFNSVFKHYYNFIIYHHLTFVNNYLEKLRKLLPFGLCGRKACVYSGVLNSGGMWGSLWFFLLNFNCLPQTKKELAWKHLPINEFSQSYKSNSTWRYINSWWFLRSCREIDLSSF